MTNATFSNSAVGTFNNLSLGTSATAGSSGTVLLQSGADVTTGQLLVGFNTGATTSGSVTVTGAGSTWTINGGNALQVGAVSGSTAALTVASGGVFNSGTGNSVMNPTGTLALNGGTFVANGGLTVNGGQFARDAAGTFALPAGRGFFIQSGGDASFTGPYTNMTDSTIIVSGAGSTFSASGALEFNNGSKVNVTAGGAISNGAAAVIISGAGDASVTVHGAGSSFRGGTLSISQLDAGSLTFSNGSTGAFGSIIVQDFPIGGGASGAMAPWPPARRPAARSRQGRRFPDSFPKSCAMTKKFWHWLEPSQSPLFDTRHSSVLQATRNRDTRNEAIHEDRR